MLSPTLKNLSFQVLIPITVIYSFIFLTGVAGNLCVCLVIIRHKSLHTATNYYLFSLALADLVILVLGLPYELTSYWQQYPWVFGEPLCKIRALISEMTSYASVLTIVAFSMERYLAICHPLYQYAMSGFNRAVKIISLIWILSFSAAFPYLHFTRVNFIDRPMGSGKYIEESALCALLDSNIVPKDYPLHQLSSVVFFLFPLCVLMFLYIRMGLSLHETSLARTRDSRVHGATTLNRSKDMVLRMLVAVVVAFFLCWAPFHAQRLGYVYFKHTRTFGLVNEYLFYISGFFYYFSATVNPVLYNVMSLKYRHAFKATLCGTPNTTGVSRTYTFRSTLNRTLDTDANIEMSSFNPSNRTSLSGMRLLDNKSFRSFTGGQDQKEGDKYKRKGRGEMDMSCHVIQEEEPSSSTRTKLMICSNSELDNNCLISTRKGKT
ncbi:neuropeptides capa receptor [Eurytemora carolleeae]|uniref:neuropeptides capa receptor n=1 Tax=Eurytemora carolleeae TaxID=1294199 RepID=UPI000C78BD02|nr:neuropeptides capa receptor [Eurytemora carolleeae]|eukprot:XP_023338062.1 neuropeptides capa receptor-like [Eurytemora affinis]